MSETFLPVLDDDDVVYSCASTSCLQSLTPVYHCALRFITGCSCLTHHCELYAEAGMPSLTVRRYTHWMALVYKTLLYLGPTYTSENWKLLCRTIKLNFESLCSSCSNWSGQKKAFSYSAPSAWDALQSETETVRNRSLETFSSILRKQTTKFLRSVLVMIKK